MILLQSPESFSSRFFFWTVFAQQENAWDPEAGKELSWAGEQHFFVSFLGTSLGLGQFLSPFPS